MTFCKRRFILALCLGLLGLSVTAQEPDDFLDDWGPEPEEIIPFEAETRPQRQVLRLLDDFEVVRPWSNDSADDHAVLELSRRQVSSGKSSLCAAFEAYGRGKFQLRRDGSLDLSQVDRLLLDVFVDAARMRMAIGLATRRSGLYFESPRLVLEPGWNRDLSISLTTAHFSLGDEAYKHLPRELADVIRLSLLFYEDGNASGKVYVDNLRAVGPQVETKNDAPPSIRSIRAKSDTLPTYGLYEIQLDIDGTYQDFFDREDIRIKATFYSPAGRRIVVDGFFDGVRRDSSPPRPIWKVRFTPGETGRWVYDVVVSTLYGEAVSPLASFTVLSNPRQRGFVRVSRTDPQCFEFDNGEPFYPVGQNVAWATNMRHYLKAISDYGGNTVRIWLAPWHLDLQLRREPGRYDTAVARQIDGILRMAETYDLYVILVLNYHGILRESWHRSPYNEANGGPCRRPEDFFVNAEAQGLFRRKLDYLCARYGSSTHLFAWELFNEADFASHYSMEDVTAWHQNAIEHLRTVDVYRHLTTTSVGNNDRNAKLYELDGIDFAPVHLYTPNQRIGIDRLAQRFQRLAKPVFLGEVGAFTNAGEERADARGVYLHASLWYSFMSPWAGSGLPWWWDTHIEADGLYHHLRALARFARGEDRRGHRFRVVDTTVPTGAETRADVRGLLSPGLGYLWIHDAERMTDPKLPDRPVVLRDTSIEVDGLLGGAFAVEVWDAWKGRLLAKTRGDSRDGRLEIHIPASHNDLSVKIRRLGMGGPRVLPGIR